MQYPTANITYKGLTDNKATVTILDENKNKWTVWKLDYEDKTKNSDVYDTLLSMKLGETFGVTYKETDESFTNDQGKVINFKKRTIYSILPTVAKPTMQPKITPNTPVQSKEETDWDKIAVGKCQTVFLEAYIGAGHTFEEAKLQVTQAKKLAELVVYGTQQIEKEFVPLPEELPQIQQQEDYDVDSIPF